jgi:hypothetical protein
MSSEKQSEQTETTTGRDNAELTPGSESASTATTAVATATAEASESSKRSGRG